MGRELSTFHHFGLGGGLGEDVAVVDFDLILVPIVVPKRLFEFLLAALAAVEVSCDGFRVL